VTAPDQALAGLLAERGIAPLFSALEHPGEETRVVGGAVRNALLGRPVHEVDLATTHPPGRVAELARAAGFKAVPTGIEHGTVTIVVKGRPFEVTTLREDVETDGRHAVVRFGRDFAADAARRDFTMNALSLGRDGRLHDYVGGLDDLRAGRVRFIGDAHRRIQEDYLRILRFFRFSADYAAGPVDPDGFDACIRGRDGLARLSRERVRAELMKLMAGRRASEIVNLLSGSGLLARLVGGIADSGRLARAAAADLDGRDSVRRLAASLVLTREDADRLRERLRLSNAEVDRLAAYADVLARLRSGPSPLEAPDLRRIAATAGLPALLDALVAVTGEPRPRLTADANALAESYASGREGAPVFPLAGRDLLAAGVSPGPELGRQLAAAKGRWLEAGCPPGWRWDG
jgi:tRNA nucleotidyltransferase/poly(A) polymerase